MAALVLTNAMPLIGSAGSGGTSPGTGTAPANGFTITSSTDLSQYTTAVTVDLKAAPIETTNFASGGYHAEIAGIKSASFSLTFNQSYTATEVDSVIRGLGLGGTGFIDIKPTSAARGTANPSFVASFIVADYTWVNGSVGALNTTSVTWNTTGSFGWITA